MIIECVPMPKEIGDMSPVYFKVGLKGDTGKTRWNSYHRTFFLIYSIVSFFLQNPSLKKMFLITIFVNCSGDRQVVNVPREKLLYW